MPLAAAVSVGPSAGFMTSKVVWDISLIFPLLSTCLMLFVTVIVTCLEDIRLSCHLVCWNRESWFTPWSNKTINKMEWRCYVRSPRYTGLSSVRWCPGRAPPLGPVKHCYFVSSPHFGQPQIWLSTPSDKPEPELAAPRRRNLKLTRYGCKNCFYT